MPAVIPNGANASRVGADAIGRARRFFACTFLLFTVSETALGWGAEGHSIVAEIAQRRLSPAAGAAVAEVLGRGVSLASVSSWADDMRETRRGTFRWHFVDIPVATAAYDASIHCEADRTRGDCVVAELERLRTELRCAPTDTARNEALRFAVHFVADIHQPFHTVGDARGATQIPVSASIAGATCTGSCVPTPVATNLHAIWDSTLIQKASWNWGATVDVVERDLRTDASAGPIVPVEWANETHVVAQRVWRMTPKSGVIDDAYYREALPIVLQQLGRAGVRLAALLNDAYASNRCPIS